MKKEIMGRSWGSRSDDLDLARAGEETVLSRVSPGIPHEDYRVLAMRAALSVARGAGRKIPSTADFARGKSAVDRMLVDRGLGVAIPGARPGRVTR